jgi:hypothetical protein
MSSPMGPEGRSKEWRKSRHSMANGNCVEVAAVDDAVVVRDSVEPGDIVVSYSACAWHAFIDDAKNGKFDTSRSSWSTADALYDHPLVR